MIELLTALLILYGVLQVLSYSLSGIIVGLIIIIAGGKILALALTGSQGKRRKK